MRIQLIALTWAICAAAVAVATTPAHAQYWGLQAPGRALSGMGVVAYQTRDWVQCNGQEQGPPQRAIAACGRIIGERSSRETTASAHYYRSVLYRQAGDTARADADVERAITLLTGVLQSEPDDSDSLNNLIFLRIQRRDFSAAAMDYSRLAALRPQSAEPRIHQGEFHFRAADYISAISAFDMAAHIDPANAQAQSGRCEARAAANRELEVAQQACAEAVRLSNGSSAALFSQGFLYFKQGNVEGALGEFESAMQQDNTNPFAAYGYAIANLRLGRHEAQASELLTSVSSDVPEVAMYGAAGLTR